MQAIQTTHTHMHKVRDFCERDGEVKPIELPGGVKIYPFSNFMTVFSHKNKAYAVSGMVSPFENLWQCQIRDISRVSVNGIDSLGLEAIDSMKTLKEGRLLSPDECKALWQDMKFSTVDVLRLLDKHIPDKGEPARKSLERAGVKFATKEEAMYAFEDAGTFRNTSMDRVAEEMFK